MPDVPAEAIEAVAVVLLRQYLSEYDAPHLTWRDFEGEAREILAAAAPILAEAVAQKIVAHMEAHGPSGSGSVAARNTWRRHFRIAAQVAHFTFHTYADMARIVAEAIARDDVSVCTEPYETATEERPQ